MNPVPWSHLLAGPLIALDRRVEAVAADGLADDNLTVAIIANELLQPKWRGWFGSPTAPSRTDLDTALEIFLDTCPPERTSSNLLDWYGALVASPIAIEWRDHQPFVAPESVSRWEILANFFDLDALLTFDLANKRMAHGISPDLEGLEAWQTLPQVSDFEMRQIFSRGISDLHIHAGGVRIVQAVWCDLMAERRDVRVFRQLDHAYATDRSIAATSLSERDLPGTPTGAMHAARKAWKELTEILRTYPDWPRASAEPGRWWTWSKARLIRERYVLLQAWAAAMAESGLMQANILRRLDRYLRHKHRFFRLVRQPVFEGIPGLRHFDRNFFPLLRRSDPKRSRARRRAFGPGPRRYMGDIADACMYLLESADLRRIELRIAPEDSFAGYIRFLGSWAELEKQLQQWHKEQQRHGSLEVRFAVHFKRSLGNMRRGHDASVPDTVRMLRALDRDLALLRRALVTDNPEHQRAMSALARIDVAGQERDTQLGLFVMHMRLLRGDPAMLEVLDQSSKGHPCARWLEAWQILLDRDQGWERPALTQPELGMTAHAGEDYADVLDGLHQIGVATDYLGLRPGDSIGHALALKAPIDTSGLRHLPRLARGAHHDSLCWLYDLFENSEAVQERPPELGSLPEMILRSGLDIYEKCHREVSGARPEDFIWVWRHKLLPRREALRTASGIRQSLIEFEYRDDELIRRREQKIPDALHEEFGRDRIRLDRPVALAQVLLLDRIKQKRIVIEMNPASNLRVSGALSLGASPTVALIQETARGLLASINTDNPGVFGSRIENEYALLLAGLRDSKIPEAEARELP